MSNFSTLSQVTGGQEGTAPRVYAASTPDSLATILATGYLNDLGDKVKLNDRFYINYSDTSSFPLGGSVVGEASIAGVFYVVVSGSNVSLINSGAIISTAISVVTLTASQFNGMYAAPVQLVAAPGAGKLIVVSQSVASMVYGSAAFAAGGVVGLQYGNTVDGAGVQASTTIAAAEFFATASTNFLFTGAFPTAGAPFTTSDNLGIYISNLTQAFTTGTGSAFSITTYYNIVTV